MINRFFKVITLCALFSQAKSQELNLNTYLWKNRVLVLEDTLKDSSDIKKAQKLLGHKEKQLQERDLVILSRGGQKKFKIRLIGKDGGQKWESGPDFKTQTIFDLIDSMPMRQREMREKSQTKE
jgi:hypothetical protein